jgi:hypothetical protein
MPDADYITIFGRFLFGELCDLARAGAFSSLPLRDPGIFWIEDSEGSYSAVADRAGTPKEPT